MRGYTAFVKKEWMEAFRTYKVFLMAAVFLVLGIMNPLTAKLLPVIFEKFPTEGMTITMGAVGAKDSWQQFYKNVPQVGLIILVILFSYMLTSEFSKGTMIPMLAKGVRRDAILLAKYTVSAGLWTGSYAVCAVVSWAYTVYFWPKDHMENLLGALFMVWLFGLFLLALLLFMGTLTKRMAGTLLGTGGVVVVFLLAGMIPKLEKYNPASLLSVNMALLQGSAALGTYIGAILITVVLTVLSLAGGCIVFRKQLL